MSETNGNMVVPDVSAVDRARKRVAHQWRTSIGVPLYNPSVIDRCALSVYNVYTNNE